VVLLSGTPAMDWTRTPRAHQRPPHLAACLIALALVALGCGGEFDASPYCRAAVGGEPGTDLVPLPAQILRLDGPATVRPAGVVAWDADATEAAAIAALAERAGLAVATSGAGDGGMRITLHPPDHWQPLLETCGLGPTSAAEAYYLLVEPDGYGVDVNIFAPDAAGRFWAIKTLAQLTNQGTVRTGAILDWPATPMRGVIEGFYGEPWDDAARLEVLARMADLKLNTFVYAPKGDPEINLRWLDDFSAEEVARMQAIAATAAQNRITPCWELHPGGTIVFSRQQHLDALLKKYRQAAEAGFRCFELAFDDVAEQLFAEDLTLYGSYVEGMTDFASRAGAALLAEHPDAAIGLVPPAYWTNAAGAEEQLTYLGANLPPEWQVGWTGPEVVAATISGADVDSVAAWLQRPPTLGDNYPVSESATTIYLGPLVGRSPEVIERVKGFIVNPMPLPYASLPAIATASDYAWNPAAYDPRRSLHAGAIQLSGGDAAPSLEAFALEAFALANCSPTLAGSVAPDLDAAIAAFWASYPAGAGLDAAATDLRAVLSEYANLPDRLATLHPGMLAEVQAWVDKLGGYGTAGGTALDLLTAHAAGTAVDPDAVTQLATDAAALQQLPVKPTGDAMDAFLAQALASLP
jgi:hyaluronoglucosaminidase